MGERVDVHLLLEVLDRHRVGQVALVVLDDDREVGHAAPHLAQVLLQVLHRLAVLLELAGARVRDEHDPVDALQHEAARRLVVDLPGDRVELELRADPGDGAEVDRHVVEVQRPLTGRRDRGELAPRLVRRLAVNELQVRRLPGHAGTVVDDLALDLLVGEVDLNHRRGLPGSLAVTSTSTRPASRCGGPRCESPCFPARSRSARRRAPAGRPGPQRRGSPCPAPPRPRSA